jgi:hypothetical protein
MRRTSSPRSTPLLRCVEISLVNGDVGGGGAETYRQGNFFGDCTVQRILNEKFGPGPTMLSRQVRFENL